MFTHKVALVLGPPGTEKTFIGVKFIQLLLENIFYSTSNQPPIMIVCQLNHALDQFLEKIIQLTPLRHGDLIRLGNRSKCEL
jgi:superfamily II DNA or RNA helicase